MIFLMITLDIFEDALFLANIGENHLKLTNITKSDFSVKITH